MEAKTVDFATLFSFEDEDEHIFVNRSFIKVLLENKQGKNLTIMTITQISEIFYRNLVKKTDNTL